MPDARITEPRPPLTRRDQASGASGPAAPGPTTPGPTTSPPPSGRVRRMQWIALTLLVVTGAINYLDRSTLSVANSAVSQEMGLSKTEMGFLLSVFSFSYAFAQLPVGFLIDRIGPRRLLAAGLFVWSVAQGAAGFVTSYAQFVAARVVLGIGEAPQFPTGAKVVSSWFAPRERGFPTGIYNSASTIGPAIAPPILTALMLAFGWRAMFITMGVAGVVGAILWYILYRNPAEAALSGAEQAALAGPEGQPGVPSGTNPAGADTGPVDTSQPTDKLPASQWARLFGFRETWGMIFGFAGWIYSFWLYLTWLPNYLETERHLSIAQTGWVASIPFALGVAGALFGGALSDRLARSGRLSLIQSRKYPVVGGLVGVALFSLPVGFVGSTSLAVALISLAMFSGNIATVCAWALTTAVAPRNAVGSLGSIQNFGGYLGGSFAPIVTGFVVDRTGSFLYGLVTGAVIALVAAGCIWCWSGGRSCCGGSGVGVTSRHE